MMNYHEEKKKEKKSAHPTFYEGKTCNLVPLPRSTSKTLMRKKGQGRPVMTTVGGQSI
jgi:hypothetical protein